MQPPRFWYPENCGAVRRVPWQARLLSPLGLLYHYGGVLKTRLATPHDPGVPVLCIGNLTAGGTGKTPLGLTAARLLKARGAKPVFLTRGYGGRLAGPVEVDPQIHTAADVGDEPLLLAGAGPVIVSRDRVAGADAAVSRGADIIIMDDGFQNPALRKTRSILVVDGEVLFGNEQVIPAGPMRERLSGGLARADAVVMMGGLASPRAKIFAQSWQKPFFEGLLQPDPAHLASLKGRRFHAFAGIGRPEKFFGTARASGLNLAATRAFPDHHMYSDVEMRALREAAEASGAALLTTSKDAMRLAPSDRALVETLPVTAEVEPAEAFADFLLGALK